VVQYVCACCVDVMSGDVSSTVSRIHSSQLNTAVLVCVCVCVCSFCVANRIGCGGV